MEDKKLASDFEINYATGELQPDVVVKEVVLVKTSSDESLTTNIDGNVGIVDKSIGTKDLPLHNIVQKNLESRKEDTEVKDFGPFEEIDDKELDEFLKRVESTRRVANSLWGDVIQISYDDETFIDANPKEVPDEIVMHSAPKEGPDDTSLNELPEKGLEETGLAQHPEEAAKEGDVETQPFCIKRRRVDVVSRPHPFTLIDEKTDGEDF